MATFKATVLKDKMRADKTWTVFIRFTHEKKVRYIATTMQATRKDLTASFKIKNQQIVDKCDDLIREYRRRIASLNLELNVVPIDTVVDMLKRKGQEGGGIDFAAFARRWCDMHGELKGIRNYRSALAAFCRFFGRDSILAAEVTARTLKAFEESLADRPRARSLYTTAIARLFGEAREYYPYASVTDRHPAEMGNAPSGTAAMLAGILSEREAGTIRSKETYDGALGADIGGTQVFAERLSYPGPFSGHTIRLARKDEVITISVDDFSSGVFTGGVLMAVRKLLSSPRGVFITSFDELTK